MKRIIYTMIILCSIIFCGCEEENIAPEKEIAHSDFPDCKLESWSFVTDYGSTKSAHYTYDEDKLVRRDYFSNNHSQVELYSYDSIGNVKNMVLGDTSGVIWGKQVEYDFEEGQLVSYKVLSTMGSFFDKHIRLEYTDQKLSKIIENDYYNSIFDKYLGQTHQNW